MGAAGVLMLVTAILETILGIPLVGGLIIIGLWYVPLVIMLILHIISLVFASNEGKSKAGNVVGIVASCLGWIPFVGFALHIATAIVLYINFAKKPRAVSAAA